MAELEQEKLHEAKMKQLIDNCSALKMDPALVSKAYVYTTPEKTYSMIWTKEESHNGEKMYYYYRVQILELFKNGDVGNKNYILEQNWGAFDTLNHRKRSESFPLSFCIKKFNIQTTERSRNYVFARIKDNNINNSELPLPIRELIIRYIFNIDFLERMMNEYTFDVKNKIMEFIKILNESDDIKILLPLKKSKKLQYICDITELEAKLDKRREFLNKQITCQSNGDDNNDKSFSLMNFYYQQLHVTIKVLDINDDRFKIIEKYFENTKTMHRDQLQYKIDNVFVIERPCDDDRYTKNLENKTLLWHGTPSSNIPSILYEGFKIKPLRAFYRPSISFSNSVFKSATKCGFRKHGVIFLCEVALGKIMESNQQAFLLRSDQELPFGVNSIHSKGMWSPDPDDCVTIDGDVVVPYGKLRTAGSNPAFSNHDKFTVFNPAQIKMRYLVSVISY